MRVAFIGLGHMGGPMSRRLAEAGLDLTVFDLDAARAAPALERGARLAASAAAAASGADVLITMLPTPAAVEEVMLGAGGALEALPHGALWIDMSTSSPAVGRSGEGARRSPRTSACSTRRSPACPPARTPARSRSSSAATPPTSSAPVPSWSTLATPSGSSTSAVTVPATRSSSCSTCSGSTSSSPSPRCSPSASRAGVDLEVLHRALVEGPASSRLLARDLLPLLRDGEYEEGFSMALATKDLRLAIDLARSAGVPAELSAVVEQLFVRARAVVRRRRRRDDAGAPLRGDCRHPPPAACGRGAGRLTSSSTGAGAHARARARVDPRRGRW